MLTPRLVSSVPRFRRARRELRVLAEREAWSRGEIESFQCARLNALWSHAVRYVPYYRRLAATLNLPERFATLDEFRNQIPILSRSTVRANAARFRSERARPGFWRRTSGSTGAPLNVYWGRDAHLETLRGKYRFEAAWGLDLFDRKVLLWGHDAAGEPGWQGRRARLELAMTDRLRCRQRFSVRHLSHKNLQSYLDGIARYRPASIYGYASAVDLLAREALDVGFRCDSLRCVIVTSEPATDRMRRTIQEAFGVPVIGEYGSIECGFLAGEFPDGTLRVREDMVLMETAPAEHGHHDILVTILTNPSFPLFRYAIGDVTDDPLLFPNRGLAVLGGIGGRENDLILNRSGGPVHPTRFEVLFEGAESQGIRRYRVHQELDGSVRVRLELAQGATPPDTEALRRKLERLVEGYPVSVEIVEIVNGPGDKHRFVTSDLGHDRVRARHGASTRTAERRV